ncbi:MAG: hypothetical protein Q7U91_00560 [Sideroxyarcus sp.]|nr:hypothetical protein [Sideroxyarcus sp.]
MITFPARTQPRNDPNAADGAMQPFEHLLDFKTFASLRRMVSHQQSKPLLKRSDFMQQITLYLPEVAARIAECDFGVVHLEVGALKLATADAIANRDFAKVRRYLFLIAEIFERADAELYDAIRISYLEGLFLDEQSNAHLEARSMLSRPMENVLRQAELRLEKTRV